MSWKFWSRKECVTQKDISRLSEKILSLSHATKANEASIKAANCSHDNTTYIPTRSWVSLKHGSRISHSCITCNDCGSIIRHNLSELEALKFKYNKAKKELNNYKSVNNTKI